MLEFLIFSAVRLNERNGDLGKGILEIYKVQMKKWVPACVQHWNPSTSPASVCSMLGYSSVNSSKLTMRDTNLTLSPSATSKDETAIWRMYQRKRSNVIKEFASCPNDNHPVVDLTCSNYGNERFLNFNRNFGLNLCGILQNAGRSETDDIVQEHVLLAVQSRRQAIGHF